jgi:hypothetical protein
MRGIFNVEEVGESGRIEGKGGEEKRRGGRRTRPRRKNSEGAKVERSDCGRLRWAVLAC